MQKKILKGLLFIAIFVMISGILSYVFSPKNNDRKSGMLQPTAYGILTEKENTIDTLIIGDSETYSSISPMQIWKEHGYTSYVCGTPAQQLYQSYDFLEKILKTQQPKVVILETNALYRRVSLKKYASFCVSEILPIFKYHDRWKQLTKEDFTSPIEYTWTHDYKGFRYANDVKSSEAKEYMKYNQKYKKISLRTLYFLDKIHQLCQENDIQLILLSVPSLKNWNYNKHNGVQEYADKHQLEFIDLNLMNDEIKIDWKKDTRDKGDHLNYSGAVKVTKYVGNYLNELGILENHQNDQYYQHWNKSLRKYEKMIRSHKETLN